MTNEPTCGDCGDDDATFRECCFKYLCDDCHAKHEPPAQPVSSD